VVEGEAAPSVRYLRATSGSEAEEEQMSPRSVVAAAVLLALAVTIVSCAPAESPHAAEPTVVATPAAPTASPTPEQLVVAPGARPPEILDGDCEAMLTTAEVSAALELPATLEAWETETGYDAVSGAGALYCEWSADGVDVLRFAAFPPSSVEGIDLAGVDSWDQDPECGWYCSVLTTGAGYTFVTTTNIAHIVTDRSQHEETVAIAEILTPIAAANISAAAVPWTRDRAGWLDPDCSDLAAAVGEELGRSFVGEPWGIYIDPPLTDGLVADEAARFWVCRLIDESGQYVEVWGYAGAAWGAEISAPSFALPRPWSGQSTGQGTRNDSVEVRAWEMTDGVNLVSLSVPVDYTVPDAEMAAAVATALTP
jgi:hypothetical protein